MSFEHKSSMNYVCAVCDSVTVASEEPPYCMRCRRRGVASRVVAQSPVPAGPGTELKKLIARFQKFFPWWDMQPHAGCGCTETAAWMDRLGPDGCESEIGTIVDKLADEAEKRNISLPFQRWAAEKMVRRAIRRARKNQKEK